MDTDYCWYHLKNPFKETPDSDESVIIGVQVKDSRHGKGLFATRNIQRGEPIMEMKFKTISSDTFKKRYEYMEGGRKRKGTGPFTLTIEKDNGRNKKVDSICYRNAPSFANDPKGSRRVVNAEHLMVEGDKLWLYAKKRIPAGKEILVNYGDEYWKGSKWIQFKLKYVRPS